MTTCASSRCKQVRPDEKLTGAEWSRVALAFPQRGLEGKAKCILISVHFSCGWNEPQPHRIAIQDAGILLNLQFVKPLKRCAGYPYYPLQKVQISRHLNILNVYCPKNCCPQEASSGKWLVSSCLESMYLLHSTNDSINRLDMTWPLRLFRKTWHLQPKGPWFVSNKCVATVNNCIATLNNCVATVKNSVA